MAHPGSAQGPNGAGMMAPERLEGLKSASTAIASLDPDGPGGFTMKHVQLRAAEILELVAEVQRLQALVPNARPDQPTAGTSTNPGATNGVC